MSAPVVPFEAHTERPRAPKMPAPRPGKWWRSLPPREQIEVELRDCTPNEIDLTLMFIVALKRGTR